MTKKDIPSEIFGLVGINPSKKKVNSLTHFTKALGRVVLLRARVGMFWVCHRDGEVTLSSHPPGCAWDGPGG